MNHNQIKIRSSRKLRSFYNDDYKQQQQQKQKASIHENNLLTKNVIFMSKFLLDSSRYEENDGHLDDQRSFGYGKGALFIIIVFAYIQVQRFSKLFWEISKKETKKIIDGFSFKECS